MKQKLAIEFVVSVDGDGGKHFIWKKADEIQFVGGNEEIYLDGKEIETIHSSDISQIIPIEMESAKFADGEISVNYAVRLDVGKEFISWGIDGWEEVKKYVKKVMVYDGRRFIFSCWNSDRMEIIFSRGLREEIKTAKVSK